MINVSWDDIRMSGNHTAHGTGVSNDLFGRNDANIFKHVLNLRSATPSSAAPHASVAPHAASAPRASHAPGAAPAPLAVARTDLFHSVPRNVVQSIRAFRPHDLAAEALRLGAHFLYANCIGAANKAGVLEIISSEFRLGKPFGKNYDALYRGLTEVLSEAGEQPGFVVVLDSLPTVPKFDKDARESLLDVFREAAEFWSEEGVPFRVFYSFA